MARKGVSITATGVQKAARKLRDAGELMAYPAQTMDELAADAPNAVTRIARRTGRLEASIKDGADEQYRAFGDWGYQIGTEVFYGRFVFRGTKHMKARPPRVARSKLANAAAQALVNDVDGL